MQLQAVRLALISTSWGWVGLAATAQGLCGLTFPEPSRELAWSNLSQRWPGVGLSHSMGEDGFAHDLLRYFSGERVTFQVTVDLPDRPAFWRRVWLIVADVPYGETVSYGVIARAAGVAGAARAVGAAMAHNPVAIVVPCHRVIGSDGRLVGFGGGLALKRRLLTMEARCVSRLGILGDERGLLGGVDDG